MNQVSHACNVCATPLTYQTAKTCWDCYKWAMHTCIEIVQTRALAMSGVGVIFALPELDQPEPPPELNTAPPTVN
jgi:hypothetical protein